MSIVTAERCFQGDTGRDEFQREPVAAKVISLLISAAQVSPMVIDGDWGTGKTEFCHKLIYKFKAEHENYRLIYVDAFKADHADNPLMTILAEVLKLLPEGEQRNSFIQKALPVIRYGLKATLKASVAHILRRNADDIADEIEGELAETSEKAIDASVETLLKEHEKAEESLEALQSNLTQIAKEAPIIFFIDELDRCRPDFSVEVLEIIKHTIDIQNVQFVLVTNTNQLKAALNHIYGAGINSQRYLDKFIKFRFVLPNTLTQDRSERLLVSITHYRNLIYQSKILKESCLIDPNLTFDFVNFLISHKNLSVREVETFVRHMEIYHQITSRDGLSANLIIGFMLLRIFGIFLFCFEPELTERIVRKSASNEEILSILNSKHISSIKIEANTILRDHEIIAKMLTSDTENIFGLGVGDLEYWNNMFLRYFQRRLGGQGNLMNIVVNAIDALSFRC